MGLHQGVSEVEGLVARLAVVFFFELRARVLAAVFVDFFFDEAFEADFFRVTFFPEPLRFDADFPAFFDVFLPDVFFFVTFFLLAFLLPEVDFLVEVLAAGFFLREVAFFLLTFFALAAAARVVLRLDAVFFETFFLVAAFFFGIRRILRWPQNQPAIIHRRRGSGSPSRSQSEEFPIRAKRRVRAAASRWRGARRRRS